MTGHSSVATIRSRWYNERMQFTWDAAKAEINVAKHGVSFKEAATVFEDEMSLSEIDEKHSSADEVRYEIVGLSQRERILLVIHVFRNEVFTDGEVIQFTRLISARRASRKERERYYGRRDT